MSDAQATQQVAEKKPQSYKSAKRERRKNVMQMAHSMLSSERLMQNMYDVIDRASVPASRVEHPNPRSLAAAIATYPDLVDAFDPDYKNMVDSQASFATITNRSVAVWDIVYAESIDIGLIQY